MVTRAEEAQEESMICKICGDEVDEVRFTI